MATQTALIPIEQYLRTSYSPDVDYVDGIIEERHLGEFDHGRLQALLTAVILSHEPHWNVIGVVEQRIRVAGRRVRIADIAMLRADTPREPVTETPPFICIEILSPEEHLSRARVVLQDYLSMGVEHIWLIDPLRRVAYTYDAAGLHEHEGPLTVANTPISIDVEALFARLD